MLGTISLLLYSVSKERFALQLLPYIYIREAQCLRWRQSQSLMHAFGKLRWLCLMYTVQVGFDRYVKTKKFIVISTFKNGIVMFPYSHSMRSLCSQRSINITLRLGAQWLPVCHPWVYRSKLTFCQIPERVSIWQRGTNSNNASPLVRTARNIKH